MIQKFVLYGIIIIISFYGLKMILNEMKKIFFCKSLDEIKKYFSLCFGLSFILLIPMPLLVTVLVNTPGYSTIDNDWIGFFGSYFGAVLGGIITLFVLAKTLKSNERTLELTLQEERKQHEENKALTIRPYLAIEKIVRLNNEALFCQAQYRLGDNKEQSSEEFIRIKNIGLGPAINVTVDSMLVLNEKIPAQFSGGEYAWRNDFEISKEGIFKLTLGIDWEKVRDYTREIPRYRYIDDIEIKFLFEDVLGNKYSQKIICRYNPEPQGGDEKYIKMGKATRFNINEVRAPQNDNTLL